MRTNELNLLIDRFNEQNDSFTIAMNFVAAGVGHIQQVIKSLDEKTFDATLSKSRLDEAERLLTFATRELSRMKEAAAVLGFAERYLRLAKEISAKVV